jgi:hypothetical protein
MENDRLIMNVVHVDRVRLCLLTAATNGRIVHPHVIYEYGEARAVPWVRSSVAGLSLRRPGFASGSIHVEFMMDKAALGQVFVQVLRFSPVNISFHRRSPNPYHLGNA